MHLSPAPARIPSSRRHDIRRPPRSRRRWRSARLSPASQTLTQSRNNDSYAWTGAVPVTRNYTTNGLNQYTAAGTATFLYDANGNLTSDGTNAYVYDVENRLVSATIGGQAVSLRYDPMGRLYKVTGATTTRFLYDGDELVAEYDAGGTMLKRYMHGIAVDDPVIDYVGSSLTSPRHLLADRQGSVIGLTDASGAIIAKNTYDEYGIPKSDQVGQAVVGRFAYTGQIWLPEIGMYHYKARLYSPTLGRFLQTDPIGYDDQINLYAYVGNDPINLMDPSGTERWLAHDSMCLNERSCPMGGGLGGIWFNSANGNNANSASPPPNQASEKAQSPQVQTAGSASGAIVAPGFGASAAVSGGVSWGSWNGTSTIYIQGQAAAGVKSGGAFASAGPGVNLGYGPQPSTGLSITSHAELNAGVPAASGSMTLDGGPNGRLSPSGGGAGRIGFGPGGAGVFQGTAVSGTVAIKVPTRSIVSAIVFGVTGVWIKF